jgi:catechol 2,3-dioxygenase-like lactoylglutathione lyase family enzyme
MSMKIAAVTVLVPDYEEGVAWFRDGLGFIVLEDRELAPGKRWIVVAPNQGQGARFVLAKASDAAQRARIGDPTGGRVAYFLETDDFARDHAAMTSRGVRFLESPRHEAYGTVAVFVDAWGGKWDLIEPRRGAA